jgi:hypothetical protein
MNVLFTKIWIWINNVYFRDQNGRAPKPGLAGTKLGPPNVEPLNPGAPIPPIGPVGTGENPPVNGGLTAPIWGPPTTLGGPTGVTTPGVLWIPGVIGSASKTGPTIGGLTMGATNGGLTIGAGVTIGWEIIGAGAPTSGPGVP